MYKARFTKEQIPLSLKVSLIHGVIFYECGFNDYEFYDNSYSFCLAYQDILAENYNFADPYRKMNADGYVESFTREEVEKELDGVIDDAMEKYIELLNDGRTSDWFGLFEKVEEK